MKLFRLGAMAVSLLVLAGCQAGNTFKVVSSDIVDRTYKTGSVSTRDRSATIEVAAKAKNHDGKVMLCVAVAGRGSSTFANEWPDAIAKALIVKLDGSRLATGTPFARTYIGEQTVMGKSSQCAVTDRVWNNSYETKRLELDLPPVRLNA